MNNKSDDVIRKWVLEFFAIIEKEYGHPPERLDMDIRLENGDVLLVHRTPRDAGGGGDVEVEFVRKLERSSQQ